MLTQICFTSRVAAPFPLARRVPVIKATGGNRPGGDSRGYPTGARDPEDETLQRILAIARRNNAAADLTGALFVAGGRYFQILEGPADAVDATYRRIAVDPRHENPEIIFQRTANDRLFEDCALYFALNADLPRTRTDATCASEAPAFFDIAAITGGFEDLSRVFSQRRHTAELRMM